MKSVGAQEQTCGVGVVDIFSTYFSALWIETKFL